MPSCCRCWLARIPFYGAFLAPVCLTLVVNLVIFVLVMRQLFRRSSNKLTTSEKSKTSVRLRGAFSLLAILGLTWFFAILAIGDFGIVFNYLFAIFNTLQGFFIFIFYCVLKEEARKCWRNALPCFKSPYEAPTSTQSQSQGTFLFSLSTALYLCWSELSGLIRFCKTMSYLDGQVNVPVLPSFVTQKAITYVEHYCT